MSTPTACILCAQNCGLRVELSAGRITRVVGDKDHPISRGYLCQKAARLDYYQRSPSRLTTPLRRRADGSFEPVDWDTAIAGVARALSAIRDAHGGHALAYYGGGGQGNHLGGAYGSSLRAAMETRYIYSSLAQEKTGGFWVNGRLFGSQRCHPMEEVHGSDYVLFIGTNPWQSHGFPRARKVLREIASDPKRTMVVIDPRRTETAEMADVFLQVRPGGDAHLMLALLAVLVQEQLVDAAFIDSHTSGYEALRNVLSARDVAADCRRAGVEEAQVRQVARGFAAARAGCVRTDLGLEHSLHSTLNTYLSKLLFVLTGNFAKPGTNTLHASLVPIIGHSKEPHEGGRTTRVTGTREIGRLYPPNVLPAEIDTDHPERIRGLVVDSANPIMTAADTQAYRAAFEKLETLVVIDVAMTETARHADWILPASSQLEKWEATFFNLEFPDNFFHLRRPLFEPLADTLPEPEIYRRLTVAMGRIPARFPILERLARLDRRMPRLRLYPLALKALFKARPKLGRYFAAVVYATLGKALPEGAQSAAILWLAAHKYAQAHPEAVRRTGLRGRGAALGEALFQRILEAPSGTLISSHRHADTWKWITHAEGRIAVTIPEMLDEIDELDAERAGGDAFPLVLMAGERRSYNANTIIRDERWRKKDPEGALAVHPDDAERLGLSDGGRAICESSRGRIEVTVRVSEVVPQGVVSLPHGFGMVEGEGAPAASGPHINQLTDAQHCDAIARTPFHKNVPVRVFAT